MIKTSIVFGVGFAAGVYCKETDRVGPITPYINKFTGKIKKMKDDAFGK